jgi:H+/Cl- antiporter ClcA
MLKSVHHWFFHAFSRVVGLAFPQILFFGYETLNALLANKALPTETLVELLFVKMFTTAVAAGSGLVGGTFAPSLFLGGMLGASFHNAVSGVLNSVNILASTVFTIADVPAYGEKNLFLEQEVVLSIIE